MKRVRYKHWLSRHKFAPKIDDDRMVTLIRDVRQGDRQAINEMIEGHLRLANGLISRYASALADFDDLDELVSAAWYAVVYAVNRIATGHLTHTNASGYIAKFLHQFLHAALKGRSVISNPRGHDDCVMCCQLSVCNAKDEMYVEPDISLDVEEEAKKLATDATDSKIIQMLRLGYSAADIARDLDLHKGNVSRRIHRIRQTYLELINE